VESNNILGLIAKEKKRQQETLMLIPSENYTYPEVRRAVGSVLMHKYAEGQPHRRYYQGNTIVDQVELECERAALAAFSLSPDQWGVNVQPHSGCEANLAVYNALLSPGDRIMSMSLPDGGHLSHGWHMGDKKVTFVSKIFDVTFYHVDEHSRVFDYDAIRRQAQEVRPKLLISGGTAYPREIDHQRMGEIAKSVGASYLADVAHEAGLIAAGANTSPFPFADVVTMTTHKTLRGPRGALIFCRKDLIDKIDFSVMPGLQGGPHLHTIAGIAIALQKTKSSQFSKYAKQVVTNARRLAEELIDFGFDVVSGGTDKHLVLVDLRNREISGWFVGWALELAGIIANRNTVPNDTSSPYYPSGLRLGTPAVTVRGMKKKEMDKIAEWIKSVVEHLGPRVLPDDQEARLRYLREFRQEIEKDRFYASLAKHVAALCRKFPVDLS
jgi:glycine hydroxymethyltransferase